MQFNLGDIKMNDILILRELAKKYAEIANDCINAEKINMWIKLNKIKKTRPLVMIDQLPWEEMNINGELDNKCTEPFYKNIETELLRKIFQNKYFPCDLVIDNFIEYTSEIKEITYGIVSTDDAEKTIVYDKNKSRRFSDQLSAEEDIKKIKMTVVKDLISQEEKINRYDEIFSGIIPIKQKGLELSFQLWDFISFARGVEICLYDMIDRPEFLHMILKKFSDVSIEIIDYCEKNALIYDNQSLIHCTGAYTDYLNSSKPKGTDAKRTWTMQMSQIMSEVSPAMHEEYELPYILPIYQRFGANYYGCCEPLHLKTDMIRKYPNVKKISMSPWANKRIGAEKLGSDYVMSIKPNPSFFAFSNFNINDVINELEPSLIACKNNNTPCEIILKDVTTINGDFNRIIKWHNAVMKLAEKY